MRWYPSKVDAWLAVVLALAPLACIAAAVGVLASDTDGGWVALAPLAFVLAIYGGLVFPMRYAIGDDSIIVRYGLVRQRIPLADITEVAPTRNPLSAPALSLDRLHVTFGTGRTRHTMISPADKETFLTELAARARLDRDGDRLVRR